MEQEQVERGGRVLKQLETVLQQECSLYSQYIEILDEEALILRSFTPETMNQVVLKREKLTNALEDAKSRREALVSQFPQNENVKLSEILARCCHLDDVTRIMPLVLKLKGLIEEARKRTVAHKYSVNFSAQMVSGLISIIWSAGQRISKIYGKTGKVEERVQPQEIKTNSLVKRV